MFTSIQLSSRIFYIITFFTPVELSPFLPIFSKSIINCFVELSTSSPIGRDDSLPSTSLPFLFSLMAASVVAVFLSVCSCVFIPNIVVPINVDSSSSSSSFFFVLLSSEETTSVTDDTSGGAVIISGRSAFFDVGSWGHVSLPFELVT